MELLLDWLLLTLAVFVTALMLPGFRVKNFTGAVWVAALFGTLNFLIGWLFFAVFTVVTLGIAWLLAFITRWIIDAIVLSIVGRITTSLHIRSFGWALGGALLMSLVGTLLEWLVR